MNKIILTFLIYFCIPLALNYEIAKCKSESCYGDQCRKIECVHGECSVEGFCECNPCWSGRSCESYENLFYPKFQNAMMQANMQRGFEVGNLIYTLRAVDNDIRATCNNKNKTANNDTNSSKVNSCDCGVVLYGIVSGNEDNIFSIGATTGKIKLMKSVDQLAEGARYLLKVSAVNQEVDGSGGDVRGPMDYAVLNVTKGQSSDVAYNSAADDDVALERFRRAVPDTVANLSMNFIKIGNNSEATTMYVGTSVRFQLQLQFEPSSSNEVSIELFTAQNTSTIMLLCKPEITYTGSNLAYSNAPATPVLDSNDGSLNYDRAVINLGTVTNTGAGIGMDSVIQIEFEAILIISPDIEYGGYYWVSAGAEYNSQNEIWIGQIGFQAVLDAYDVSSQNPQFNMTGPSEISHGASAVFRVDMYLPYPAVNLYFDVFSPFNYTDAVTVCHILVVDVGKNYECYRYLDLPLTLYPSKSEITNERGTLDMETAINKGSRHADNDWMDNRISVEFVLTVLDKATLLGEDMWIGATLEIGLNEIWAIQHSFTVIAPVPYVPLLASPVLTFYGEDNLNAVDMGFPKKFILNISIAQDTLSPYVMDALTDGTKFTICKSILGNKGKNIPCFNPLEVIVSKTADNLASNKIDWNIGELQNMGLLAPSIDPHADILELSVYVSLLNYPGISQGDTSTLSGSLTGSNNVPATFTSSITVNSLISNATATNYSIPTFNLTYEMGSTSAYINQTLDLRLEVTLYPGALNYPFTMIFYSSNFSTEVNHLNLVRAELLYVGENLPCTNRNLVNESVTYSTLLDPEDHVGIFLDFGGIINLADPPENIFVPTKKDRIILRLVLFVKDETNTLGTLESTVTFASNEVPWTDTQSITIGPAAIQDYNENQTSYMFFDYSNTENSNVPAGFEYKRQVLIKTPPKSVATWQIMADATPDPDITVCAVVLTNYGYDIPYLDRTPATAVYKNNGRKEKAWLGLYPVTNIENQQRFNNDTFDQSSFVIEVIMQISSSAAQIAKTVNISADHGLDGVDDSVDANFVVVAPVPLAYDPAGLEPNVTFYQSKVNEDAIAPTNDVYLGQTLIVTTELAYPLESVVQNLKIKISGPSDGTIDIVQYHIVQLGVNFPCSDKLVEPTITKTGANIYNDEAVLDIGVVSQTVLNTIAPENWITVEAVVTIVRASTAATGAVINLVNTVTLNGTDRAPETLPLTITATVPTVQNNNSLGVGLVVEMNATELDTRMRSNTYARINASMTIMPSTSDTIVITLGPLPAGAPGLIMSVEDFTVISVGKNLGSIESPFSIAPVMTSLLSTSQMNQAVITIDRITNTGHSYRSETYIDGDDDIVVEALIRFADDPTATLNTNWDCTFTATYLGATHANIAKVVSDKQTTDDILIDVVPFVDDITLYKENDNIPVKFWISHNNLSTTETFPLKFIIYLTPFFQLVQTSFTYDFINSSPPTIIPSIATTSFAIEFPHFFFTDNVTFSFDVNFLPDILKSNTPIETIRVIYELDMVLPSKSVTSQSQGMNLLNFTCAAKPLIDCDAEIDLGMASALIIDCQLSGSPGQNAYTESRPGGAGWIPGLRKGSYDRYLQIHLGNVTKVTKVTLTQTATDRIKDFRMDISHDGIIWKDGGVVTAPDTAAASVINIPEPEGSTFIRFHIISTYTPDTMPAFTIELHGCLIYAVTDAVPCNVRNGAQPVIPHPDFKRRMMATDLIKGYFCDTLPNLSDVKCFSSADGYTWQVLDRTVVNILGYTPSKNRLYGLDRNMKAIVLSQDNGDTWNTVSNTTYLGARSDTADYLASTNVPWNKQIDTTPIVKGSFSGKYDGVYYNSVKVANWMGCCA